MIFVLDKQDVTVGVLSNNSPLSCPYYNDQHIESLETGVNTYEFSIPANHEMTEKVESNGSIVFQDVDGMFQIFAVKELQEVRSEREYSIRVFCEHTAISELLTDVVRPFKMPSASVRTAVEYVLRETDWELGEYDSTSSQDVEFLNHVTSLEALKTVKNIFDAEIQFEVIYSNGTISKKLVHLRNQLGSPSYKVFSYTKDLKEVIRTENSNDVITALIVNGAGDSSGKTANLLSFSRTVDNFETKYGNDYIEDHEALQRFGKNGKHLFGVLVTTLENKAELFEAGMKELKKRNKPTITYDCKVELLERIEGWEAEKVRVGDTVRILDYSFEPALLLEARVLELRKSYTRPNFDEVLLGDYVELQFSPMATIQKLQDKINEKERLWESTSIQVAVSSSVGDVFKNGIGSTILTAKLFKANAEIDIDGSSYTYKWYKSNKDGVPDSNFGGKNINFKTGKTLEVSGSDIEVKAIFTVEVE